MKVRVSTKGQIVLPKEVRNALGIDRGSVLDVKVEGSKLVLTADQSAVKRLYGKYSGELLLEDLEKEHIEEIAGSPA